MQGKRKCTSGRQLLCPWARHFTHLAYRWWSEGLVAPVYQPHFCQCASGSCGYNVAFSVFPWCWSHLLMYCNGYFSDNRPPQSTPGVLSILQVCNRNLVSEVGSAVVQ
ncbi:hypothetical protein ATANTOWER_004829 [Ataeniobius toweri]|uniref:Uncharacterized protein n=1 Tax=Ataeniobius toweri TaxID=208326 RepID=A0ABU7A4G1_9TELE|nr:hypothetical protein [Ataeniobius toweri]